MAAFGLIMLLSWPIVVAVLFSRMPRQKAAIWSILAGYLFLPPVINIDLPAIPPIDKATIPAMAALFFAYTSPRREGEGLPPPPPGLLITVLFLMMLASPILTAATNPDTLFDGIVVRPNVGIVQGIGEMIVTGFHLIPFILGYWLLSDRNGPILLAKALIAAMLVYSIPMLIEVRLSPQMNVWVYGFFQHDFVQTMRYGGFRPIVFLQHPLWVAFLTLTALVCAVALTRAHRTRNWFAVSGWLGMMLVICKTLGVLVHAFIAVPILWFLRPRMAVLAACLLGVAVVSYPAVRAAGILPVDQVIEKATGAEADRGQSLEFRLINETILLARAQERVLFGWGGWGRALIVNPESGEVETITDGEWIRVLGERGVFGFVAEFFLLLTPLIMLLRAWPKAGAGRPGAQELTLAAIAMILGLNMVDLVPNATLTPITWMMAGIVAGAARRLSKGSYFEQDQTGTVTSLTKKTGLNAVL